MKANRRSFLGFMAAAPVAGKALAEQEVANLSSMNLGLSGQGYLDPATAGPISPGIQPKHFRAAFLNPKLREEIRSELLKSEQHISSIDPDLASKRSFSLAAKIYYQRQRNVERRMKVMQEESWLAGHSRIYDLVAKFVGLPT